MEKFITLEECYDTVLKSQEQTYNKILEEAKKTKKSKIDEITSLNPETIKNMLINKYIKYRKCNNIRTTTNIDFRNNEEKYVINLVKYIQELYGESIRFFKDILKEKNINYKTIDINIFRKNREWNEFGRKSVFKGNAAWLVQPAKMVVYDITDALGFNFPRHPLPCPVVTVTDTSNFQYDFHNIFYYIFIKACNDLNLSENIINYIKTKINDNQNIDIDNYIKTIKSLKIKTKELEQDSTIETAPINIDPTIADQTKITPERYKSKTN